MKKFLSPVIALVTLVVAVLLMFGIYSGGAAMGLSKMVMFVVTIIVDVSLFIGAQILMRRTEGLVNPGVGTHFRQSALLYIAFVVTLIVLPSCPEYAGTGAKLPCQEDTYWPTLAGGGVFLYAVFGVITNIVYLIYRSIKDKKSVPPVVAMK